MPNWCDTFHAFTGDRKALIELQKKVKLFTREEWVKEHPVRNGFGNGWLGHIAAGFGFDPQKVSCRGELLSDPAFFILEETECLLMNCWTAWAPCDELWDAVIDRHFCDSDGKPLIRQDFQATEPSTDLYVSTSDLLFPDKYLVEYISDHISETELFRTKEDTLVYMNGILKENGLTEAKTIGEALVRFEDVEDKWLSFHEYKPWEEEEDNREEA